MCCYWNCWCHMVYLFFCYHSHFIWCHLWSSSRFPFSCLYTVTPIGVTLVGLPGFICSGVSTGTSLGTTFGGLPSFIFCTLTLGVGSLCCCCLVGYQIVICAQSWYGSISTAHRCTLFLLVDCWSDPLVMILNNSTRFINSLWCVSLIFSKVTFVVGFCNACT